MKNQFICMTFILAISMSLNGQIQNLKQEKQKCISELDSKSVEYTNMAMAIWQHPELGYQEVKSTKLLQDKLSSEEFTVTAGVAGMPTAFVASYGSGHPVVGILAEFDALPGVSQQALPYREERKDESSGHACGHHLFGSGGVAAAIAIKDYLKRTNTGGTIRLYGTPAEEGGSGKVYMVRAGLFDDADVTMYWHAGDENAVRASSNLAIVSVKFRFSGVSAHAAGAPYKGRSALDGVEALNYMANLMREHVTPETRIHYVITKGGEAPNVVPAFAEVYYFIRHPEMKNARNTLTRMIDAAKGAALGTGTTMDYEITGGSFNVLPNEALAKVMQANLEIVGGVNYTPKEKTFAEELMTSFDAEGKVPEDAAKVVPLDLSGKVRNSSTDSGDVSWVVPLVSMRAAAWPPGTSSHTWQAVAAGGTSIGAKGMMVAAKTMAMTGIDIFANPRIAEQAKQELVKRRGLDFIYESLLGDRDPALDYMKN